MGTSYLNLLFLVIGLVCCCQGILGSHELSKEYNFSAELAGDDYILHWTADRTSEEIRFAVNVSTTGWVGFGLSPNGQMPDSDVVIGWVAFDNDSQVTFHVSSYNFWYA